MNMITLNKDTICKYGMEIPDKETRDTFPFEQDFCDLLFYGYRELKINQDELAKQANIPKKDIKRLLDFNMVEEKETDERYIRSEKDEIKKRCNKCVKMENYYAFKSFIEEKKRVELKKYSRSWYHHIKSEIFGELIDKSGITKGDLTDEEIGEIFGWSRDKYTKNKNNPFYFTTQEQYAILCEINKRIRLSNETQWYPSAYLPEMENFGETIFLLINGYAYLDFFGNLNDTQKKDALYYLEKELAFPDDKKVAVLRCVEAFIVVLFSNKHEDIIDCMEYDKGIMLYKHLRKIAKNLFRADFDLMDCALSYIYNIKSLKDTHCFGKRLLYYQFDKDIDLFLMDVFNLIGEEDLKEAKNAFEEIRNVEVFLKKTYNIVKSKCDLYAIEMLLDYFNSEVKITENRCFSDKLIEFNDFSLDEQHVIIDNSYAFLPQEGDGYCSICYMNKYRKCDDKQKKEIIFKLKAIPAPSLYSISDYDALVFCDSLIDSMRMCNRRFIKYAENEKSKKANFETFRKIALPYISKSYDVIEIIKYKLAFDESEWFVWTLIENCFYSNLSKNDLYEIEMLHLCADDKISGESILNSILMMTEEDFKTDISEGINT